MLLRYGLTFEDIELLDAHIDQVSETEITVKESIRKLSARNIEPLKRYI